MEYDTPLGPRSYLSRVDRALLYLMAICVPDPLTEEERLSLLLDPDPLDGGPHDNAWEPRLRREERERRAGQRPEWGGLVFRPRTATRERWFDLPSDNDTAPE